MLMVIVNVCSVFSASGLVYHCIYSVQAHHELGVTIPFDRWEN